MSNLDLLVISFLVCSILSFNFIIAKYVKFYLLNPVYIFSYFFQFTLVCSIFYFYNIDNKINLFGFDEILENTFINNVKYYLIAVFSFLLGVVFVTLFSKKSQPILSLTQKKLINIKTSKKLVFYLFMIFLTIINVILFYIVYGDGIFLRREYIPDLDGFYKAIKIILFYFNFIIFILIGTLYKYNRFTSKLLFIIFIILNLSTGSRRIVLYCVIYLVSILPYVRFNFIKKIKVIIYVLSSFILLLFTIQFRKLDDHGLVPYFNSLPDLVDTIVVQIGFIFYYLFIYGFFVTAQTLKSGVPDIDSTLIALNPLTGGVAGWHDLQYKMRLNEFAPFNMHGEIFSMGFLFTIIFFFIIGFFIAQLDKYIKKQFFLKNHFLFSVLIFSFFCIFTIYGFQYNFRTSMRIFYFIFGIIIFKKILTTCFVILKQTILENVKTKN